MFVFFRFGLTDKIFIAIGAWKYHLNVHIMLRICVCVPCLSLPWHFIPGLTVYRCVFFFRCFLLFLEISNIALTPYGYDDVQFFTQQNNRSYESTLRLRKMAE